MQLTTVRLVLRDFTDQDWPAVLAYQTDPRYLRYYEWTGRTAADVRGFVGTFLAQQQEQPRTRFQLAVCRKAGGQLIGNCGIRRLSADAQEAEIGYEFSPEQWGAGYATEAAAAIVCFGFTQLRLHRISATCVADNTASIHVLEKLGMRFEGRLHEKEYFKGRWWDTLIFALLADEWRARRPA